MNQIKLNPDDPDHDQINPGIIELALTNGTVRQSLVMYLSGQLTWIQTLETIVLSIGKEFKAQQKILVEVQMSNPAPNLILLNNSEQLQLTGINDHP